MIYVFLTAFVVSLIASFAYFFKLEKEEKLKKEQKKISNRQRKPELVRYERIRPTAFVDDIGELDRTDVSYVDGMGGHEFEYFCADLLRRNGFVNVSVTPGSGDQGVDVLAEKGGVKYAVQCKNYKTPLSNTPVQEVNAGKMFYRCHVGVVMTNSTFTKGAKDLAAETGILLWDRDAVQRMMKQ